MTITPTLATRPFIATRASSAPRPEATDRFQAGALAHLILIPRPTPLSAAPSTPAGTQTGLLVAATATPVVGAALAAMIRPRPTCK